MTQAEILTRVKTQIRAEMGTPSVSDLHATTISQWATEELYNVILILKDSRHFPSLVAIDTSLTFTSGSAALPSGFWWPSTVKQQEGMKDLLTLKVTANSVTKRYTPLLTPDEYARLDSSNFVLTPSTKFPIGMIADKVYVKPTTITAGYIDYITTHQAIASGTEFDEVGDNVLISLILARYYEYRELPDLQALAYGRATSFGNK